MTANQDNRELGKPVEALMLDESALADYLVDNSGDWSALDRQLEILWSVLTHAK